MSNTRWGDCHFLNATNITVGCSFLPTLFTYPFSSWSISSRACLGSSSPKIIHCESVESFVHHSFVIWAATAIASDSGKPRAPAPRSGVATLRCDSNAFFQSSLITET